MLDCIRMVCITPYDRRDNISVLIKAAADASDADVVATAAAKTDASDADVVATAAAKY